VGEIMQRQSPFVADSDLYGEISDHPSAGVWLAEVTVPSLWAVFEPRTHKVHEAGTATQLTNPACRTVHGGGANGQLAPVGPREWLLFVDQCRIPEAFFRSAFAVLPRVFDLSHARVVVEVSGSGAVSLLAKGCPVALDDLAPGSAVSTVLGPYSVVLVRAEHAFHIVFSRTYARSGWAWLVEGAQEFSLRFRAPHAWTGLSHL
jgi:heterotetrameric sarcosine oxidase gamma subunit